MTWFRCGGGGSSEVSLPTSIGCTCYHGSSFGSAYSSFSITMHCSGSVTGGGTIYKNGVATTAPVSFVDGDVLTFSYAISCSRSEQSGSLPITWTLD